MKKYMKVYSSAVEDKRVQQCYNKISVQNLRNEGSVRSTWALAYTIDLNLDKVVDFSISPTFVLSLYCQGD